MSESVVGCVGGSSQGPEFLTRRLGLSNFVLVVCGAISIFMSLCPCPSHEAVPLSFSLRVESGASTLRHCEVLRVWLRQREEETKKEISTRPWDLLA